LKISINAATKQPALHY